MWAVPVFYYLVGSELPYYWYFFYTISFLFQLFKSCIHDAPKLANTLVHNSYKQRYFPHNHNTTIKIGKLTLMHYYHLIHTLHPNFICCFKNAPYTKKIQSRIMCCILLSCLFSLLQIVISSLCFLVFYNLDTFEECLSIWVCLMCLIIRFRFWVLVRNVTLYPHTEKY